MKNKNNTDLFFDLRYVSNDRRVLRPQWIDDINLFESVLVNFEVKINIDTPRQIIQ